MTTAVGIYERRTSEEEVVATRIACVNTEVPITTAPIQRSVEIKGFTESAILPVEQYVFEVKPALKPIVALNVGISIYVHEIIEVYLVGGLILLFRQIELVCHLVGEEQCLLLGLCVAHCVCCSSESEHHNQGWNNLFHSRIF